MAVAAVAGALLPILVKSGAGLLAGIVRDRSPAAAEVIEKIGSALGVPGTVEAIVAAHERDPEKVEEAVREVEDRDSPHWNALAVAAAGQAALFAREDSRESAFSWAWRPAMSWLLIFLWLWNAVLIHLVNAVMADDLPVTPWEQLLGFSGLWLAIYGGGNTIKSIWGKAS